MTDRYQPLRDAVATSSLPVGPTTFPRILELLDDLLKERDALLAVRNDTLETAALICDARERRAGTRPAQACYRLMAKDIRALKGGGEGGAPEPPAQQPMSRDREVWRAAITLANNICVQESDRYNGDDATQEASATGYCAQRIRDWIAPTDEQFAELLEEAGIGKGESNEG